MKLNRERQDKQFVIYFEDGTFWNEDSKTQVIDLKEATVYNEVDKAQNAAMFLVGVKAIAGRYDGLPYYRY